MSNTYILITGGSGFFGSHLKRYLLAMGMPCISVDIIPDDFAHPDLISLELDVSDSKRLAGLFQTHKISAVIHCAAKLAHHGLSKGTLWHHNVNGSREIATQSLLHDVNRFIFISTNCVYGKPFDHMVDEATITCPVEAYGESKLLAEESVSSVFQKNPEKLVIIRCPTIIAEGRVGLLGILFDLILHNQKVWMIGAGINRYQFIAANDLADACVKFLNNGSAQGLYHIGSDDVPTLKECFLHLIRTSGSRSKIIHLPKWPATAFMKIMYGLGLSPLGPYHWRMIAENFVFDTRKIKKDIGWAPSVRNQDMLVEAFNFYKNNSLAHQSGTGPHQNHRQSVDSFLFRLLRLIS